MKAMEDKVKAVLAECERLCPQRGDSYKISESRRLEAWPPAQPKGYGLHVCGHWIYINGDTTPKESDRWDIFHSLLSLGVQSPDENKGTDYWEYRRKANNLEYTISCAIDRIDRMFKLGITDQSVLSLSEFLKNGATSPAPDENAPIPKALFDLSGKIVEAFKTAKTYTKEEWAKVDFRLLNELWDDAIEEAWNTRAHAPSAGKDQEIERWRNACHEHESKKLAMKSKADKRISELKEKTSKLIEALEKISATCESLGNPPKIFGLSPSIERMGNVAKQALAAYNGKEAKEGGEG